MGIQGFLPLLKSITKTDFKFSQLRGANIGIDASGWLHRGSINCGQDLAAGNPTDVYVNYFLAQLKIIIENKPASIFVVFDGCSLPTKQGTHAKRNEIRQNNLSKALECQERGDFNSADVFFGRTVKITFEMVEVIISALKQIGIPYIVAPYEADAQLAHLCQLGIIDTVISEDGDTLIYGCNRLICKYDNKTGGGHEIKHCDLEKNKELSFAGWTPDQFSLFAVLSGCDYAGKLHNMGIKTAHKYISYYKTFSTLIKGLEKSWKHDVIDAALIKSIWKAYLTYRHQTVYNLNTKKLQHLNPITDDVLPQIHQFCGDIDNFYFLGHHFSDTLVAKLICGDIDPHLVKQHTETFSYSDFSAAASVLSSSSSIEREGGGGGGNSGSNENVRPNENSSSPINNYSNPTRKRNSLNLASEDLSEKAWQRAKFDHSNSEDLLGIIPKPTHFENQDNNGYSNDDNHDYDNNDAVGGEGGGANIWSFDGPGSCNNRADAHATEDEEQFIHSSDPDFAQVSQRHRHDIVPNQLLQMPRMQSKNYESKLVSDNMQSLRRRQLSGTASGDIVRGDKTPTPTLTNPILSTAAEEMYGATSSNNNSNHNGGSEFGMIERIILHPPIEIAKYIRDGRSREVETNIAPLWQRPDGNKCSSSSLRDDVTSPANPNFIARAEGGGISDHSSSSSSSSSGGGGGLGGVWSMERQWIVYKPPWMSKGTKVGGEGGGGGPWKQQDVEAADGDLDGINLVEKWDSIVGKI